MAKRELPHSIDAEKSLLGCLLVDPELCFDVMEILDADDFYYGKHKLLFENLRKLYNEDIGIDTTIVSDQLKKQGNFDKIGGYDYLAGLIAEAPLEHNVTDYAKIIKDQAKARALIETSQQIIDSVYTDYDQVSDLLSNAEQKIFNLTETESKNNDLAPIREVVFETLMRIQQINQNRGKLTGISTGLTELDEKTSGLQNSDLIIIAARPSMGKTALALNIATHAALHEDKSVLIFSLEMSREQLVQRMILSEALIDSNKVRTGDLNGSEDWEPITMSAENLASSKVIINDTPALSLSEIRSICRRQKVQNKIDLLIIDYMQLMTGDRRNENRQTEISEISRGLKQIAREMDCPVICLSQLARGPESRLDKRPMLSDLRDSGSIEQDADVVMFLYRDAYYNKEEATNPYDAELNIAKQRNGPTGTIKLRWLPMYTKFTDPAPPSLEPPEQTQGDIA